MPGVASSVQDACGLGMARRLPSRSGVDTSTRHCRQAPDGREQRVVAEPRDLDADLLGGPDDERALGDRELHLVDGAG